MVEQRSLQEKGLSRLVGWLVGRIYSISSIIGYLMPNPFYTYKQFYFKQISLAYVRSFNNKTLLFQTIHLNRSTLFSSVWPVDRILLGATTPSQSGSGTDSKEGVLRIPQSSSITETSLSETLVSFPGYLLWGVLPLCRGAVGVFYRPSRLGNV